MFSWCSGNLLSAIISSFSSLRGLDATWQLTSHVTEKLFVSLFKHYDDLIMKLVLQDCARQFHKVNILWHRVINHTDNFYSSSFSFSHSFIASMTSTKTLLYIAAFYCRTVREKGSTFVQYSGKSKVKYLLF